MPASQAEKAERFRALHARPGAFVIPNPWDAGTARILTRLGFEALTTTSAGLAFTLGRRDGAGAVTREETLANAKAIVDATDLPVAADLENGFGHAPGGGRRDDTPGRQVAGARRRVDRGRDGRSAVGRSTTSSRPSSAWPRPPPRPAPSPSRSCSWAGPRTSCTAGPTSTTRSAACRRSRPPEPTPSSHRGSPGATTSAPCARRWASRSTSSWASEERPVSVAELAALGVRRISVGSALCRAALGAFVRGRAEIREQGTFALRRGRRYPSPRPATLVVGR